MPRTRAGRLRLLVLGVALAVTAVKLWMAATMAGTNDVFSYMAFAKAIRHFGPIGIYGQRLVDDGTILEVGHVYPIYNHPPLIGLMLIGLDHLSGPGHSLHFLVRVPATLADIVTSLLIFELVRMFRSLRDATVAGVIVACSPALIIIYGYHGNTDPIFVMFSLLSLYLLVTGRSGILAGLALTAAINIKIVPIILIPLLALIAWRRGRRCFEAFSASFAISMAVIWLPVFFRNWAPFAQNVIGYKGINEAQWGILQFAKTVGLSPDVIGVLRDQGRFPLLLLTAGLPFLLAWKRPAATMQAFGFAFALVLLLSTSTGGRYLVWAIAPLFLVDIWGAVVYNAAVSVFLVIVYDRWNNARPWNWDRAHSGPWVHREVVIAAVVWLVLLGVGLLAFRRPRGPGTGDASPDVGRGDNATAAVAKA